MQVTNLKARRSGLILLAGCLILLAPSSGALAQEKTPIPEYTGERVYVKDVPDRYQGLNKTIKELERSSPQSYFVVVVRSAGSGQGAATTYVDEVYDTWRSQATARSLKLDPERSVIVLVAIQNRKVAVHTGRALRQKQGLSHDVMNRDLINRVFIPLAKDEKYPEAIRSLLIATNNFLAQRDPATAEVKGEAAGLIQAQASRDAAESITKTVVVPEGEAAKTIARGQTGAPPSTPSESGSTAQRDAILGLFAALAAVVLIMAGLIWLARRRTRNTVEGKIKDYRKKSVEVMDKLDALKARLKMLPTEDPDFKEPMAGQTLAMYEKLQGDLTGLWDRWLEVMDVLDKAQALARKDSALGSQKLKEAEKLVSDSKVFEQIDEESKACAVGMDDLNNAHEKARSAVEAVTGRQVKIEAKVGEVTKEGLPTAPYQPELVVIAGQANEAKAVLTPDPIGASSTLGVAEKRAATLEDRVDRILRTYQDARTVSASLKTLGDRVAKERSQGLRLDEDGGNPDHPLAQTFQKLEDLRAAVHQGDPAAAEGHLGSAKSLLAQAEQTLDGVLKAREFCDKDHPERIRETQRLREALGQYEAFETELRRDFAPSSWQNVAGNLAQSRALLETFDRKLREAAEAATPTSQKYILGSRLLGQVAQEQQVTFRLMAALGEQLQGLRALRDEAQKIARSLEDLESSTAQFYRQNDQVIGAMAKNSLASAQQSARQVATLMNDRQPDWPRIHQLVRTATEEYANARNQAETDLRLYQELSNQFDRVRQDAGRVQAFLAGHEEDRLAANQHYQNAEETLNRVQKESKEASGEWARLIELLRGASADLAHSERLAQEDIRLARQAEAEIEEAVRTMRKARAYFSMGVTLNTVGAESQVSQAEQLYRAQNYEQSIRTAAAAIQQVRQAYGVAAQQAFWRQMQVDANRPQYPSGQLPGRGIGLGDAAAAAAAAGAILMGGAASAAQPLSGPAGGDFVAPGAETEPSTASGSWASESAEGGW